MAEKVVEIVAPVVVNAPDGMDDNKGAADKGSTGNTGDFASLRAELDVMKAERAAEREAADAAKREAEVALEAERQSKLSASERAAEELKALREQLAKVQEDRVSDARKALLLSIGVGDKWHEYAPRVDVGTPDGRKAIEDWVDGHREVVSSGVSASNPFEVDVSKFSGSNPLINVGRVKDSIRRARAMDRKQGSVR